MKKPNTTGDEEKRRILENDPLTDGVEEARCRCRVCGTWIELGSIPQIQLVNWADHCKKYHSRSVSVPPKLKPQRLEPDWLGLIAVMQAIHMLQHLHSYLVLLHMALRGA